MLDSRINQNFNRPIVSPQLRASQNVSKPAEVEDKKGLSFNAKWTIGLGLTALAATGIYLVTNGRVKAPKPTPKPENPILKIKEMTIDVFKRGKDANKEGVNRLVNGRAVLADGTKYTGNITSTGKDGSKVVMEYVDGVLQKSIKTAKDGTKLFEKAYTYGTDNKISKVKDLVKNSDILSKEIQQDCGQILTRTSSGYYIQDLDNKNLLRINTKDFYYDSSGLLKYTKDENNLITAYYPNGKIRFSQNKYGLRFYDETGKEVAYYQSDFNRGAKQYCVTYPDRKIKYDITSQNNISAKQMWFYDSAGEPKLRLNRWSDGEQHCVYRPKSKSARLNIEHSSDDIVNIMNDKSNVLATYNLKTGEILINDSLLTKDTVSEIMNEIKQAMSTVRKEHKQALKMREEYMKATRSITKQSGKNFKDWHYLT